MIGTLFGSLEVAWERKDYTEIYLSNAVRVWTRDCVDVDEQKRNEHKHLIRIIIHGDFFLLSLRCECTKHVEYMSVGACV